MSHEVENMAYAGEIPWHKLGIKVNNDISVDDMLNISGLNWTVSKQDMYWKEEEYPNIMKIVTDKQLLIRDTDNMQLDVVGKNWNPVQNKEAFEFFREWVEAGDMEMHTAGSLLNGKKTWVLAKIKESFEAVPNDRIDNYLLFTNPHHFGSSLNIRFTPTRVVCNNTLQVALQGKSNGYSLNHRKKFNPKEVKLTMGLVHDALKDYKDNITILSKSYYNQDSLNVYFAELFPQSPYEKEKEPWTNKSKKHRAAERALVNQPGKQYGYQSWWHAFNTVTYLYDHKLGRNDASRLNSNLYGTAMQEKRRAFTICL